MTAVQRQTTKVYIADLTKCTTKAGFFRTLSRAFGIGEAALDLSGRTFWRELCRRTAVIASSPYPVRIKITGLSRVGEFYPDGVYNLLRVFEAMESEASDLKANAS